jgi:hypothetical protein
LKTMPHRPKRNPAPPIEYSMSPRHLLGIDGLRSLAAKTGLPLETVAALGMADELNRLFDMGKRCLRSPEELRGLASAGLLDPTPAPSARQRLIELYRDPPTGPEQQTPKQRLVELYRLRGNWTEP